MTPNNDSHSTTTSAPHNAFPGVDGSDWVYERPHRGLPAEEVLAVPDSYTIYAYLKQDTGSPTEVITVYKGPDEYPVAHVASDTVTAVHPCETTEEAGETIEQIITQQ